MGSVRIHRREEDGPGVSEGIGKPGYSLDRGLVAEGT